MADFFEISIFDSGIVSEYGGGGGGGGDGDGDRVHSTDTELLFILIFFIIILLYYYVMLNVTYKLVQMLCYVKFVV